MSKQSSKLTTNNNSLATQLSLHGTKIKKTAAEASKCNIHLQQHSHATKNQQPHRKLEPISNDQNAKPASNISFSLQIYTPSQIFAHSFYITDDDIFALNLRTQLLHKHINTSYLKPENILVREDGHIMVTDFDLSLRCSVNPTLLQSPSSGTAEPPRVSGPCVGSSCIDPFCIKPTCQVSCFRAMPKSRKPKAELAALHRSLPQLVAEPTEARSNSFVGTHEYLAPEIIKGDGHGSALDWWTFVIFLYELLYGKTPFKGSGNDQTLANVVLDSLRFPETPLVSFQARDLIKGLLVKEPENRLGSQRGAAEIKQHPFFEGLNWALIRCASPRELPEAYDVTALKSAVLEKAKKYLEYDGSRNIGNKKRG